MQASLALRPPSTPLTKLLQINALTAQSQRTSYNIPILQASNVSSISDTHFGNILSNYFHRNETTELVYPNSYWQHGRSSEFYVHCQIRIPKSQIRYVPGAGEVLKFSWIQYLSLLVIVYYLMDWVFYFVYAYQILETSTSVDGTRPEKLKAF